VVGGVHHWLKGRSTREERKPVTRDNNNNNNTPLLGYIVKQLFYIPPVLMVSRRAISQIREFANGTNVL
jgi:hypothetical protein